MRRFAAAARQSSTSLLPPRACQRTTAIVAGSRARPHTPSVRKPLPRSPWPPRLALPGAFGYTGQVSVLVPGRLLGGCRIEAVVGRGGMGVVYRARQLDLDRDVAVKVIAPELLEDPQSRNRFLTEA